MPTGTLLDVVKAFAPVKTIADLVIRLVELRNERQESSMEGHLRLLEEEHQAGRQDLQDRRHFVLELLDRLPPDRQADYVDRALEREFGPPPLALKPG